MRQTAWLVLRAALALLLMVGFYALALGVAGALLWIPYEAFAFGFHMPIKLVLLCIAAAGTIVWAILPRFDRFVPPGPRLTGDDAPPLFAVLTDVSAATGQTMPADVFLVNDVNAFVAERGGLMGVGSRRVMGIGLPLMQSVTVQELRAILAHEFGHYHAGDVKVGPWIYKTRAAIGRTIRQLGDGYIGKIFVAYGHLFLRITHAISRRQEFIADEVAAGAAGAGAMTSALRKVHGAAVAFQSYWSSEVGPVLNSGFLPPLTAGFATFVETDAMRARIAHSISAEEAEGQSDPYDTHPPLRERVAALQSLPAGPAGDVRPAIALLGDPAAWERRVLGAAINTEWAQSLKPLGWDKVVDEVYVPLWRAAVKEHAGLIKGTIVSRPAFAGKLAEATARGQFRDVDQAVLFRVQLSATALSLALHRAGWTGRTSPGQEVRFERDGQEIRPYSELMNVAAGKTTGGQWAARCETLGIESLALDGGARS
jgi:Zn-dependent protease with chaperone function